MTDHADVTRAPAYPLEFVLGEGPLLLRVTDAAGRQVSCVYKRGSSPRGATVYEDESLRRVRFLLKGDAHDRQQFLEDLESSRRPLKDLADTDLAGSAPSARPSGAPGRVIHGPDGRRLGALTDPAGAWEVIWHGTYDVTDTSGENVGRILRDNPFRPARRIELRGATVLCLREQRTQQNRYRLEKISGFPAAEGELLLAAVVAVVLDDRWRR